MRLLRHLQLNQQCYRCGIYTSFYWHNYYSRTQHYGAGFDPTGLLSSYMGVGVIDIRHWDAQPTCATHQHHTCTHTTPVFCLRYTHYELTYRSRKGDIIPCRSWLQLPSALAAVSERLTSSACYQFISNDASVYPLELWSQPASTCFTIL